MSVERPLPERVPVLTEVIDGLEVTEVAAAQPSPATSAAQARAAVQALPDLSDPSLVTSDALTGREPQPDAPGPSQHVRPVPFDEADIAEAVMRRVDLQLEARLREALAPALARAADTLIRQAREDLAATVREATDFLGLPPAPLADRTAHNERRYPPMDPAVRARLAEEFRPHNRDLEALLGREMGWDGPGE